MAEILFPAASIACILAKKPESYALSLFARLSASVSSFFSTKMIVIHACDVNDMRESLNGVAARYKLIKVGNFEHDSQVMIMNEVRDEFDHCQGQSTSILHKAVESLPGELKPLC
jgi:hypothetical protein